MLLVLVCCGTALMLFLLGLEAMEPLSQEIDQPDRTDSLPIERGELLVRHLIAPAIALIMIAAPILSLKIDRMSLTMGTAATVIAGDSLLHRPEF